MSDVQADELWIIEALAVNNLGQHTWSPIKMFGTEHEATHYLNGLPRFLFIPMVWRRISRFKREEQT